MMFPDDKTTFVGLWILWLVIVFAALVTLEYIRYSLRLSSEVGDDARGGDSDVRSMRWRHSDERHPADVPAPTCDEPPAM